jgi:hypothetical protein
MIRFLKYPNNVKIFLSIYIIGFGIGGTIHLISLIKGGFLPYENVPLWKNIYWTSLTFLDFLVIIMILKSIKPALLISNLIIISDVIINCSGYDFSNHYILNDYRIITQIIFGFYILITTPIILRQKIKKTGYNTRYK